MERYVLPVDKPTSLDPSGFLALPPTDSWGREAAAAPHPVAGLCADGTSFVLLAGGGVGKTTVLDWLCDHEPGTERIDLLGLDRRGMREALEEGARTADAVYIDALDQVALLEPAIFDILKRVLTNEEARGVGWRLGCRPAAWPTVLATALREVGFHELRLLPLTRTAASEVVSDLVPDPNRFLHAVVRANLGRLSASPMQLRAAARQWHETGQLTGNQVESIEFEVRRLLAEGNPARDPQMSADRHYWLAARLGAISVLSGIACYSRTATQVPQAVTVAELPSLPDGDEPATPITPDDYSTVLATTLFEAAPHTTVTFRHHRYAEYLAARYLSRGRTTRPQVTQLLGAVEGTIPGPMAGVAAWLAAVQPELVSDHVATSPTSFVTIGVELADQVRAVVVDALMARAVRRNIDLEWGMDFKGLAYPGLEDQLRQYLAAGLRESAEVWYLSKLVLAGQCRGPVKELVGLAIDPRWSVPARRAAIAAIKDLGGDDDRNQLRTLLRLNVSSDPDDELLAGAVDTLYPKLMSTGELLAVLRPRRNRRLLGAYQVLLGQLADRVPAPDLPITLAWAAEQAGSDRLDQAFGRFVGQLVARGWDQARLPAVRDALAAFLAALGGPTNQSLGVPSDSLPWVEQPDVDRRRQLALATASRLGGHCYQVACLGLLVDDDLEWLIETLPGLTRELQRPLAEHLTTMAGDPTAAQADRVLSLPPTHPAYGATRWWRDPIALDSEHAASLRRSRQAAQGAKEEVAAAETRRRQALTDALERATADVTRWWQVALALAGGDDMKVFSHDLTDRPFWTHLNPDDQRRVLGLGLRYLNEHIPRTTACLGRTSIPADESDAVLQDWSGVYLLTTLTRHSPSALAGLAPSVWEAWAPAIVGAWNYDADQDARLRSDLLDLAPPEARDRILDFALDHLDVLPGDQPTSPRALYVRLCQELAPRLSAGLIGGRYGHRLGADLLDILAEQEPSTARGVCRALPPAHTLHLVAQRKLAELDPAGTVDDLTAREPTAREVAAAASPIKLDSLDDIRIAALGRLLLDRCPLGDDPTGGWEFRSDVDAYEVRQTRNRTLQVLSERGAVGMLQSLAEGRAGIDQYAIGHYVRLAQQNAADVRLVHPTPDELLALVSRADARLIRHSDDLLEVIVEHLGELQQQIRTGGYRFLWDMARGDEPRPKSEDDITDWVCAELRHRLGSGSALDREVQVERRPAGGIGTRIDLTVTSPTSVIPAGVVRVIAEAKLIGNASLPIALTDQLVGRYLEPTGLTHGIYLIYWVDPAQRPGGWTNQNLVDQAGLQQELEQQAASHCERRKIFPFVLDVSMQY